jgi:arylsulfate sulfotransferase
MTKLLGLILLDVYAVSAMTVSLASSVASPAPLGTLVRFTATAAGADSGPLMYRFRTQFGSIRGKNHPFEPQFRTIVDYGPSSTLDWTTISAEGPVEMEVSVENTATGETATDSVPFEFSSLTQRDAPAATPTGNPLVFIYSAPPCADGGQMRVRFQAASGPAQFTPYQPCNGRATMNFYLAGMRAATTYTAQHTVLLHGTPTNGPVVELTTRVTTFAAPAASPMSTPGPTTAGIILHGVVNSNVFATDLNGNLIWYSPSAMTFFTRAQTGGTFLSIFEDGTEGESHQYLREFDLAGVTVAETNAARVNEQLKAIGRHPITSFHHEAIRMPNGDYLVLAGSERILTDVQGPGPVDVLGDTILVLDRDLQVRWFWDAFDYLDAHRAAVLNETCTYPATVACSAFYGAKQANDWLHGNALQLAPDGNIIYSVRHQDWVVKIDYRNGAGTGKILWRLGKDGDFQIISNATHPWFSHQHDPHFLAKNSTMLLFDNGNTRIAQNPDETTSRGMTLRINERTRTATVMMMANLKVSSAALGTAQLLDNGHYYFDAGFIPDPANPNGRITQLLETDATGNLVWGMNVAAQEYRSFRMKDLYTAPQL